MKDYYDLIPNQTKENVAIAWARYLHECKHYEGAMVLFCANYDLYFDLDLCRICICNVQIEDTYKEYLKNISTLSQYKGLKFSNSCFSSSMDNKLVEKQFNLIETLKIEQELLVDKITKARENGDIGTYKNLVVALKEVTKLIHDEELCLNNVSDSICKININPNDKIIVKIKDKTSHRIGSEVCERIKKAFPNNEVVGISDVVKIEIVEQI